MKKFKYLYIGVLSAILSGTFTSCEDYLDVNKNPNYPDECGHSTTRRIRHPANISRWSTMR